MRKNSLYNTKPQVGKIVQKPNGKIRDCELKFHGSKNNSHFKAIKLKKEEEKNSRVVVRLT